MQKLSIPKGTRDFGPAKMAKRNFIFSTIKKAFHKYGFKQIETPTFENLDVLTGKYGDEGDQLIFKILNSGNYLSKVTQVDIDSGVKKLTPIISEKALRYDLTVPFARFVVMNRNDITLPFKRFQIQPVWRADRPQKGRYREFYQCDADVVGSDALIHEGELIKMADEVLSNLGLQDFTIKINNRKILSGIAEVIGADGKEAPMCVAIDKLDKIGEEKVIEELINNGFSNDSVTKLKPILNISGSTIEVINQLKEALSNSEVGTKGIVELEEILGYADVLKIEKATIEIDPQLARGLSYYTGCILEIKTNEVKMGSISGGGRYDDLTGLFGLSGLSGVGISFGVDRIYDVMEELDLFPEESLSSTQVIILSFDKDSFKYGVSILQQLRENDIASEIYPSPTKMKKQFSYTDNNSIPYAIVIGSDEMESGNLSFKNMESGEQLKLSIDNIIEKLKS